jgi:hypothetical protein
MTFVFVKKGIEIMWYGYSYDQWIGVVEYFLIMFALGIGVCLTSYRITHICSRKKKRIVRRKVDHKKQIFFDVA